MSYRTLVFPGMKIKSISTQAIADEEAVRMEIDYAIIIKNMDDAKQDTRWYGKGFLQISELIVQTGPLPDFPATVISADVKDNQITYRDEIAMPFNFHGNVGITIKFEDLASPIRYIGEHMSFDLSEHEKYIAHIN